MIKILTRLIFTATLVAGIHGQLVQADEGDWSDAGLCDISYYRTGYYVAECQAYTGNAACTEKWSNSPLGYCRDHTYGGVSNISCYWNGLGSPDYTFSQVITCTTGDMQ